MESKSQTVANFAIAADSPEALRGLKALAWQPVPFRTNPSGWVCFRWMQSQTSGSKDLQIASEELDESF